MRGNHRRFYSLLLVLLVLIPVIFAREVAFSSHPTNSVTEKFFIESSEIKPTPQVYSKVHFRFFQPNKPVITNVQITNISDTSTTITWDTDQLSTTEVNYGTQAPPVNWIGNMELVTSHSLTLTGLAPATMYYFFVRSTNEAGKKTTDNNEGAYYTFTTASAPVTTTPPVTTTSSVTTTLLFTSNDRSTEAGKVEIDRVFTTWVRFITMSGENPINGAVIQFGGNADITTSWEGYRNGIYIIKITPKKFGQFSIKIKAVKVGYDSASATLSLEIVPIETDLYFISNYQAKELAPVQINETYTTLVQFNRTSTTPETPIDNATINMVPSDLGISHTVVPLGNGRYQIMVSVNQSTQVSIVIGASKAQYSGDSVTLVLISGLVETQLRFLSNSKSLETGTVQVYDTYSTTVQFNATVVYPELSIDKGIIEVRSSSPDLKYSWNPLGSGLYQIELDPTTTGPINIDLEASAGPGYLNATASLTLIVEPIPTMLKFSDPMIIDNRLSLIYLEPIEIAIFYTDESGGMEFEHFEYETDGLVFQAYRAGEAVGEYIFSFENSIPGTYQVILTLYKTNYAPVSLTTVIVVNPIPMVNIQDTVVVITEKNLEQLTIELRNAADDSPVIGANVTYVWEGGSGAMKDLGNGIYVADLSGVQLDVRSYTFKIVAAKANHASLVIEYSLIVQEPVSFLRKYWIILGIMGCLVIGGTTQYARKERKKRRARTLLELHKRMTIEYISDITHFLNLLVIAPSGIPFYSFEKNIRQFTQELDSSLYSSFLMAVQNLAGKSLPHEGSLSKGNHFRFGGIELFLYSIRELVFVFMFSTQVQNGDWKKINQSVLERCKELTIKIERNFQEDIREFEQSSKTSQIQHLKISDLIIETLALDFIMPHHIIDLTLYREVDFLDESAILQTIEQLNSEEGIVNLFQVLEYLKATELSLDDIMFVFHKLREEGAIVPLTKMEHREKSPTLGGPEDEEWQPEAREIDLSPEDSIHGINIVLFDLEETLSLLKKLRSLMDTPSKEKSKKPISLLEKLRSLIVTPLKEKSKEKLPFIKKLRSLIVTNSEETCRDSG